MIPPPDLFKKKLKNIKRYYYYKYFVVTRLCYANETNLNSKIMRAGTIEIIVISYNNTRASAWLIAP